MLSGYVIYDGKMYEGYPENPDNFSYESDIVNCDLESLMS